MNDSGMSDEGMSHRLDGRARGAAAAAPAGPAIGDGVAYKMAAESIPPTRWIRRSTHADGPTIGILAPSYGMERVSYLIKSSSRHYLTLRRVPLHRWERRGSFLQQTPLIVGPRVDLVHTFNQLPINRDFVVSVEMELPRYLGRPYGWQKSIGMRLLESERCRGIWPLSEAARRYILRRFESVGAGRLARKLTVFRGTVRPCPGDADRRRESTGALRLLFVGGDGLGKGLGPTLEAARRLRRDGVDLCLTVVGTPRSQTYIVPTATFPVADLFETLAGESWITHHVSLPNASIRRLMQRHDVLLFPTMDESLGWVVVEAALSALPAIATNVFALPELIVDGATGWTIKITLDADGRWAYIGRSDGHDAWIAEQANITEQLQAILQRICLDRDLVGRAGDAAREHIANWYSPEVADRQLRRLYDAAIGGTTVTAASGKSAREVRER